jgi:protein-S-isoprenylcysteine O-methyltransferase Ste14
MVQEQKPSTAKLALNSLVTSLFFPALVLLASGDYRWLEGWIFSLWFVAMVLSATIYLAIGSIWGLTIAAVAFCVLVGRILGGEKMLGNELEGYSEYVKRVRARLIPFVW